MHASFESYHCCAAVVFKICKSYIYASCVCLSVREREKKRMCVSESVENLYLEVMSLRRDGLGSRV
jgi:hypothetical protein